MAEARRRSVDNDIYTILVIVALVALIAGIVFILIRSEELGYGNPFSADTTISMLQDVVRPIMLS